MTGRRPHSYSERGNVFFTLFGAVAIVGVLGAGIMATMRGPLSTMVEVNRRTQAEAQMSIASKLAMLAAVESVDDCDGDGFIEPAEFVPNAAAPSGGGFLPSNIGSARLDPWGSEFGYCVWDAGVEVDNAACEMQDGSAGFNRLDGDGTGSPNYTMIAIISAGPDRIFQTVCSEGPPELTKGGDDIVTQFDYQEAAAASDGLWRLINPDTAGIDRDIEVMGQARFSSGIDLTGPSAALQLGAASMLFPTQADLSSCNPANDMLLRVNNALSPPVLEICDGATNSWESVAAGASGIGLWQQGAGDDIYYNSGTPRVGIGTDTPAEALDVDGSVQLSGNAILTDGDVILASSGELNWGANASISSTGSAIRLNTDGGAVEIEIDNNNVTIDADTIITGSATSPTTSDALTVQDSLGNNILVVQNSGAVGIGVADPTEALDVSGYANVSESYMIDGRTVLRTDATNGPSSIFVGAGAGGTVTSDFNTVIGADTGISFSSAAEYNTILGAGAAPTLAGGSFNILIGSHDTVPVDVLDPGDDNYLNIGNTIYGWLDSDLVGIGVDDPDVALDVAGDIEATGTVTASNVVATTRVTTDELYVNNGDNFIPSGTCNAGSFHRWDGNSWECEPDTAGGGGGGGAQTLEETLEAGNDANGETAIDFGGITIGSPTFSSGLLLDVTGNIGATQYCDEDGNNCFTATDVADANQDLEEVLTAGNDAGGLTAINIGGIAVGSTSLSNGARQLEVDITGDIGADFYCDADGNNCFTAGGIAAAASPGAPTRSIQFNSNGTFGGDANFIYTSTGRLGLGTPTPGAPLHVYGAGSGWIGIEGDETLGSAIDLLTRGDGATNLGQAATKGWQIAGTGETHASVPHREDLLFNYWDGLGWRYSVLALDALANRVGIGTESPQTRLDVDGTIMMAYGGEPCDAAREGAIHYDSSTDRFYVCQNTGEGWVQIATDNAAAAAPDRGVQFNSGGAFAADANFVYTSTGRLGIGTANPAGMLDVLGPGGVNIINIAGPGLLMNWGSGDGTNYAAIGLYDGTNNRQWSIAHSEFLPNDLIFGYTDGSYAPHFVLTETGQAGLGAVTPQTRLDVDGTIKMAYSGEDCDAAREGAIRYMSNLDAFYVCRVAANGWEALTTSAAGAAAPDRGIQFNSGGAFAAVSTFVYTSTGNLGVRTATPQHDIHVVDLGHADLKLESTNGFDSRIRMQGNTGGEWAIGRDATLDTFKISHSGALETNTYLTFDSTGRLGIGTATPRTQLDVAGTIKMGYDSEACDADREGAIHYDASVDNFYVCRTNGSGWEVLSTGGATPPGAPDRSVQFNSGGVFTGSSGLVYDEWGGNVGLGITGDSPYLFMTSPGAAPVIIDMVRTGGSIDYSIVNNGAFYVRTATNDSPSAGTDVLVLDANGDLYLPGTGATTLQSGTTAERPAGVEGMIRYNSQLDVFEGYVGGAVNDWVEFADNASIPGAAAPDRGIQFNSGGQFEATGDMVYTSTGTLQLSTTELHDTLINIRNQYDNPIFDFAASWDAARIYMRDENADDRLMLSTRDDGASYITVFTENVHLEDNDADVLGSAMWISAPDGLGNENGIAFNDGTSGGNPAAAAITFYDALNGWYSVGGLRFKTNDGSGLTTRLDIDQQGLISFESTGGFVVNRGDTSQRPSNAVNGMLRYNSQTDKFEGFQGGIWTDIITAGGTAAAPDRGIQFNSGGQFAAVSDFVYTSAGNLELTNGGIEVSGSEVMVATNLNEATSLLTNSTLNGDTSFIGLTSAGRFAAGQFNWSNSNAFTGIKQMDSYGGFFGFTPNFSNPIATTSNAAGMYVRDGTTRLYGDGIAIARFEGQGVTIGGNYEAVTALDANGTIKMAYGGEDCDASREGAIRYMSNLDNFYVCRAAANDWEAIATDGSGVDEFIELTDTPAAYTGAAGQFVRVTSGEDALEFTDEIIEVVSGSPPPTAMVLNDLGNVSTSPSDGDVLTYDNASGTWIAAAPTAGAATAAPDRGIQFNSGGAFAADSRLTYTSTGILKFDGLSSANFTTDRFFQVDDDLGATKFYMENNVFGSAYSTILGGQDANITITDLTNCCDPNSTISLAASNGADMSAIALVPDAISGGGGHYRFNIPDGGTRSISFRNMTGGITHSYIEATSTAGLGTGTMELKAADVDNQLFLEDSLGGGGVGVGIDYASAKFHVDGTIMMAYGGELCDADREGAIHYDSSDDTFYVCRVAANGWEAISTGSSGAGNDEFLDLTDTPAAYTGAAGQFVRVTSGEDGLEFTNEIIESVAGDPPVGIDLDYLDDVVISAPSDGDVLTYDNASGTWVAAAASGGGGTPAAPDRGIQFNSGGQFAADANFYYEADGDLYKNHEGTGADNAFIMSKWGGAYWEGNKFTARAASGTEGSPNPLPYPARALAITAEGYDTGGSFFEMARIDFNLDGNPGWADMPGSITFFTTPDGSAASLARMAIRNSGDIEIYGTGALTLPAGTTAQRPTAAPGMIRYNSTTDAFEGYIAGSINDWQSMSFGSSGAYDNFLILTDTPDDYSGQQGKFVRVNTAENALEFTNEIIEVVAGDPPSYLDLNDLGDVDTSGVADNYVLTYDNASGTWVAAAASGGSGTPAGANTQIQFNSSGSFGASSDFTWNNATSTLTVDGDINVTQALTFDGGWGQIKNTSNSVAMFFDTTSTVFRLPIDIENASQNSSVTLENTGGSGTSLLAITGGNVGVGNTSPTERLDVTGNIKVSGMIKIGGTAGGTPNFFSLDDLADVDTSGLADGYVLTYDTGSGDWVAAAPTGGASGDLDDLDDVDVASVQDGQFLRYDNASGNWIADSIIQGSVFEDASNVIRFTSGTVNYAVADFVVGSPQLADTGNANHDARMYFDKSKGAFRAGMAQNDEWDDSNVGIASIALGLGATAGGDQGIALGSYNNAMGFRTISIGTNTQAYYEGVAIGYVASASGTHSHAFGNSVIATGHNSMALGSYANAGDGLYSGGYPSGGPQNPTVGEGSMAIGLTTDANEPATKPVVTGDQSLGIFMGNQSTANLSAANTLGIFGGSIMIDPTVGDADRGCIRYNETSAELEFSHDCSTYTAFGSSGSTAFTDLTDVPADYTGEAGKFLRVTSGENGLEFTDEIIEQVAGNAPVGMGIDNLSDVVISSAANGECLTYNGTNWVDGACGGGGGGALNDLSDAAVNYTSRNMFIGQGVGGSASNNWNTAVGVESMQALTSGYSNTALGRESLNKLTTGADNVAVGAGAMYSVQGGYINTAVGTGSLFSLVSGYSNTAVGSTALAKTTANFNTGVGEAALYENIGGGGNTALGAGALGDVNSGGFNVGLGMNAGGNITSGSSNIIIGFNINAPSATADNQLNIGDTIYGNMANDRVGIGTVPSAQLHILTTSTTGNAALEGLRIQHENTSSAGANNIGTYISMTAESNSNGVFPEIGRIHAVMNDAANASKDSYLAFYTLGANAGAGSNTATEKMRISSAGYVGILNTSPDVALDVTGDIEYSGTITDVSDIRMKDNIKPLSDRGSMLAKLDNVNTYSFTMKGDENKQTEFGVMAQEIEKIFPELVKTAEDEMGTKSVNYVGLIAPMIEASKELKAENETLRAELEEMKGHIELLSRAAGENVGKASLEPTKENWLYLLLGILGSLCVFLIVTRRKPT